MKTVNGMSQLANEAGQPLLGWNQRDSQRSKVYASERGALAMHEPFNKRLDHYEIVALVRRIENDPYVIEHYGKITRKVITNPRRQSKGMAHGSHSIELPRFAHKAWYVVHEVTHGYTLRDNGGHGWFFCYVYLDLLKRFVGEDEHTALKAAFVALKVKHQPPRKRTVTPAQRSAAADRMRARQAVLAQSPEYVFAVQAQGRWNLVSTVSTRSIRITTYQRTALTRKQEKAVLGMLQRLSNFTVVAVKASDIPWENGRIPQGFNPYDLTV